MELHPILEENVLPKSSLWYVVSAFGDRPSLRVGHTSVSIASADTSDGMTQKVLIVGGANPSECFSDVHTLDTNTLSWNLLTPPGFNSRYEHISFIPSSQPDRVYVLAGATQESNIAEGFVQYFDLKTEKWISVKASGTAPSPRTHHTTASCGDCVYVFSGGKSGAEPVQDRQVYSYDVSSNSWSSLSISGESPSPRHGHSLTVIANKIYCFGGMAGSKFYNDLHILDLEKGCWITPKIKKRNLPEPRAAHAAVTEGTNLYIFGGMSKEGMALDDLWKLDTSTMQWSQCQVEGAPPAPRLDMACCVISWSIEMDSEKQVEEVSESLANASLEAQEGASNHLQADSSKGNTCKMILVHGGMDTQGEIFDDCLVYKLE